MEHLRALLDAATTIELIDWPHQDVPAALLRAGYDVVGHEPDCYLRYEVAADRPAGGRVFPVTGGGYLVSSAIDELPSRVDIVNTYRPADEQAEIAEGAVAVGASVFWVQPDADASPQARSIAEAAGLAFVDGVSIADAVRELGIAVGR